MELKLIVCDDNQLKEIRKHLFMDSSQTSRAINKNEYKEICKIYDNCKHKNDTIKDIKEYIDASKSNLIKIYGDKTSLSLEIFDKYDSVVRIWEDIEKEGMNFNSGIFMQERSNQFIIATILSKDNNIKPFLRLLSYASVDVKQLDPNTAPLNVDEYINVLSSLPLISLDAIQQILILFNYDVKLVDVLANYIESKREFMRLNMSLAPKEFTAKLVEALINKVPPKKLSYMIAEWPKEALKPHIKEIVKQVYKTNPSYNEIKIIKANKEYFDLDKIKNICNIINQDEYYSLFKNNKMFKYDKVIQRILRQVHIDYDTSNNIYILLISMMTLLSHINTKDAEKIDFIPASCLMAKHLTSKKCDLYNLSRIKIDEWFDKSNKENIIMFCDNIILMMEKYQTNAQIELFLKNINEYTDYNKSKTLYSLLKERTHLDPTSKFRAAIMNINI